MDDEMVDSDTQGGKELELQLQKTETAGKTLAWVARSRDEAAEFRESAAKRLVQAAKSRAVAAKQLANVVKNRAEVVGWRAGSLDALAGITCEKVALDREQADLSKQKAMLESNWAEAEAVRGKLNAAQTKIDVNVASMEKMKEENELLGKQVSLQVGDLPPPIEPGFASFDDFQDAFKNNEDIGQHSKRKRSEQ